MNFSQTVVNRPIAVVSLFVVLLSIAAYTIGFLSVDYLPDVEFPSFFVSTSYPEGNPEQVERLITKPLEDLLVSLEGIKTMTSTSSEGLSNITLEFNNGEDLEAKKNDVRDRLSRVSVGTTGLLPEGSSMPALFSFNLGQIPILNYGLRGNNFGERFQDDLSQIYTDSVESYLQRVPGVGDVSISGNVEKIVLVEVPWNFLRAQKLSLSEIAGQIILQNQLITGGVIKGERQSFGVKTQSEFSAIDEIQDIIIRRINGVNLRIRDIGSVRWSIEEPDSYAYLDGNLGVNISLRKKTDSNITKVASSVKEVVAGLNEDLRERQGVELVLLEDRSDFVKLIIREVFNTAYLGGIYAILILFVFLRRLRAVFVVGLTIPICFIITLSAMYFAGISINVMSLVGLVLGVGMILDNSIIVLEKIYTLLQRGLKPKVAAFVGSQEIVLPVIASTMTNMVVFAPVVIFKDLLGPYGQFFYPLCFTVVVAQTVSLFTAILLVPALLGRMLSQETHKKPLRRFQWVFWGGVVGLILPLLGYFSPLLSRALPESYAATAWFVTVPISVFLGLLGGVLGSFTWKFIDNGIEAFFEGLGKVYEKILHFALKFYYLFLIGLGIIVALTFLVVSKPGFDVFPQGPAEGVDLLVNFDPNDSLNSMNEVALALSDRTVQDVKGHRSILARVGRYGRGSTSSNRATIGVKLDLHNIDGLLDIPQITELFHSYMKDYPELSYFVRQSGGGRGNDGGSQIQLKLQSFDLTNLRSFALRLEEALKEHSDNVINIDSDFRPGGDEYILDINREKARAYGVDIADINAIVSTYLSGARASTYREGEDSYEIRVKLPETVYGRLSNLPFYEINTPLGHTVQLAELAQVRVGTAAQAISRENRQRTITISAELAQGAKLQEAITFIEDLMRRDLSIPEDIQYSFGGNQEELAEYGNVFLYLMFFAFMLVFAIMASQFESLRDPFIIIFTVPFIFLGVVWAYVLVDIPYTLFTAIGVVMLMGVVVNNGIVFVDYTNLLRKRHYELKQAIVQAGKERLRPILMTAMTTILGMLPLALLDGRSGSLLRPVGLAVLGGFSVSSFLTLTFIPIMYFLINRRYTKIRLLFDRLFGFLKRDSPSKGGSHV